jgi:hypothetical protein
LKSLPAIATTEYAPGRPGRRGLPAEGLSKFPAGNSLDRAGITGSKYSEYLGFGDGGVGSASGPYLLPLQAFPLGNLAVGIADR